MTYRSDEIPKGFVHGLSHSVYGDAANIVVHW